MRTRRKDVVGSCLPWSCRQDYYELFWNTGLIVSLRSKPPYQPRTGSIYESLPLIESNGMLMGFKFRFKDLHIVRLWRKQEGYSAGRREAGQEEVLQASDFLTLGTDDSFRDHGVKHKVQAHQTVMKGNFHLPFHTMRSTLHLGLILIGSQWMKPIV